ncbi:MAG: adenylate/guanylate cyclase domain-containing protein [Xanthomonadales bacterium]
MGEQNQDLPDTGPAQSVILVVDDNELNRDLLTRRLAKKGFATDEAADGFKALDWLANNHCDLVLLDIMMPGMSGIAVLEKIRETRDGTELPVIMATAKDTREDIVGALQLGANDYVTKPLDFAVVLARVNTQLGMKRANDRVRQLVKEVERRNEFIRSVFGRYLTDDVAETLLDSPEGLHMGGERREITILMADIRGFTNLSSHLEPEKVVTLVNNFLSEMTRVIISYGGTIDEFIGDAILALFGAPRAMEGHAEKAVACALKMQAAMQVVNRLNRQTGLPELATGIGINTGEVIVGNIGSEQRAKYGVVGHNVNFASRVESYAAGGQILVSDRTLEACSGLLETRGQMSVRPKGFDKDVQIHDVSGIGGTYQIRIEQVIRV